MKEISEAIGLKIKQVREEKGLTQKELGEVLGYSPMGVSHFEKGIRELKISDIDKLANFFGKNISFFLSSGATMFRAENNSNEDILDSISSFDKFLIERKKIK